MRKAGPDRGGPARLLRVMRGTLMPCHGVRLGVRALSATLDSAVAAFIAGDPFAGVGVHDGPGFADPPAAAW